MSSNESIAPAGYYESDQYAADMAYESAMAGEHECPTCGRGHEGAWEFCQTCGAGACCEPEETEHHVETWFRYTAEDLFGEDPTDDQQSLWRHAVAARTDLLEENNRLQDELQDAHRDLRAAREQVEELGNEAVYYREELDEAQAARETAEDRATDAETTLMRVDEFIDRPWRSEAYGTGAEDGYTHALRAMRRQMRIRTALIVGPLAAVIGAACALAAAALS